MRCVYQPGDCTNQGTCTKQVALYDNIIIHTISYQAYILEFEINKTLELQQVANIKCSDMQFSTDHQTG